MTANRPLRDQDVLLVVDIQNDFCPEGRLAVPRGDEVVPVVNRLATRFRDVLPTQDWHPLGHLSFASTHPGRKPYDTIAASYGPQILWPDHCVQGTPGAEFRKDLEIAHAELVLRKGYHRDIDSYSAFYENDRRTRTGLAGYLRERGFTRVFLAGLAFDFCVRYSAEDAKNEGFDVIVFEDACRAIDIGGSVLAARTTFHTIGVCCVSADAVG
jgi:nicotinamidase/pyrazinamidase